MAWQGRRMLMTCTGMLLRSPVSRQLSINLDRRQVLQCHCQLFPSIQLLHKLHKRNMHVDTQTRRVNQNGTNEEDDDVVTFDQCFNKLVDLLVTEETQLAHFEIMEQYKKALLYNVPHGKRNRGLAVVKTYRALSTGQEELLTPELLNLVHIMGWCVELLQAYFLVLDDIMDQSPTRRGQPCWYKQVGLTAINDGLMLDQGIYVILRKTIGDKPYYTDVLNLFLQTTWKTSLGQSLDIDVQTLSYCTQERYSAIVKHKTSFYTFCLPIRLGMYLAGIGDQKTHKVVEDILFEMGHFFQVQDDYIDCFGDSAVMGKVGTDIQSGKCAWPLVTALSLASEEQLAELQTNYKRDEPACVDRVKAVYRQLDIPYLYSAYEQTSYNNIMAMINKSSHLLPPAIFVDYVRKLYKRKS